MAINKKFPRYLAVSLLGLLSLTACGKEVIAKPSDYKDAIITGDSIVEKIDNNIMSIIYDGIHDGDLASDVLNEVLYQYSVSVFGRYNSLTGPKSESSTLSTGTTLKQAVKSALSSDKTIADKFIKEHKAYWHVNNTGERVDDSGAVRTDNGDVACSAEYKTLIAKWDSIEDRIKEKIYNEMSGGSYTYRSEFSEKSYLISLRSTMQKVANAHANTMTESNKVSVEEETGGSYYFSPRVIDSKYDYKDVFSHYLHRENYQPNSGLGENEAENTITYVEDNFIESIYRELLTEQYLFDETYNTLGRSYARNVNVIKLATKETSAKSAQYLMNYFVKNVVYDTPKDQLGAEVTKITDANGVAVSKNQVGEEQFIALSDAYKGIYDSNLSELAKKYISESNAFTPVYNNLMEVSYYKGTDFGDLMEDYKKITDNPLTTDTSVETDFTGSGDYTVEVGLELKTRALYANDYLENGWFIKNGGLSDYSTFRDRLFNIGVASALDNINPEDLEAAGYDKYDRFQYKDSAWTIDTTKDFNKYVARINGKYYLKNSTSDGGSDTDDIIFYDASGKVYYLVQINEAVSSSKFSKSAGAKNYDVLRQGEDSVLADYVNEVAKILAKNDTYQTLAKKHWVEEMGIRYHDKVVYDYFKSNFPELFD